MKGKILAEKQIAEFAVYLKSEEKSENTIEKYVRDVRAFTTYMGKKRIMLRKSKSLQGTIACFMGTIVGLMIFSLSANYAIPWYGYLALAGATSALELIEHGLDNFSITAGTYMLAVVLLR